jgi:predicted DNA-binding ribbon-helix-helix protein
MTGVSARRFDAEAAVLSGQNAYLKVRGFRLAERRTSVSLEDAFWEATRAIAAERRMSIQHLIAEIDAARCNSTNLSSAIRIFVLEYYRGIAEKVGPADCPTTLPSAPPSADSLHSPRTTDRPRQRLTS